MDRADRVARTWTLDEVLDLTQGRDVIARDERAAPVPVPSPLRNADGGNTPAWREQIATMHPEDRAEGARAWWTTVAQPGARWDGVVRYLMDGRWAARPVTYLNLLHQSEWRVVLIVMGPSEATTDPPSRESAPITLERAGVAETATWEAPTWVIQRLDETGAILDTEGMVEVVFGLDAGTLAGRNILELLHEDDHEAAITMWLEVLAAPATVRTIRQRVVQPSGRVVWLESTVTNRLDGQGGGAVVAVSHDISERLVDEQALRASREEFRILAEEVPVAVFRCDDTGKVLFANVRMAELFAPFGAFSWLHDLTTPAEHVTLSSALEQLVSGSEDAVDLEVSAPDGELRLHLVLRRVGAAATDDRHAPGEPLPARIVGVVADITETATLRHLVNHDALTGLANRRAAEDHLAERLAQGPVSLAFVDLDGFKAINDRLGHRLGDEVLADVGSRLRATAEVHGGLAGRWGGDEFLVVMPDPDPSNWLDDVHAALEAPALTSQGALHTGGSVGVVTGDQGDDPTDLVRQADEAMYAAKRSRRRR
ncbi:MAG: diguanylate cyclase [Acidimicrobiia bacterium]|nr:diguanylate cyclase [Acidimicrobiia bacterium]